jgi:hypothetical protein
MGSKAIVIVTHYSNPVEPVVIEDTGASNLHFGELTPQHARRERRRQRGRQRQAPGRHVIARYW